MKLLMIILIKGNLFLVNLLIAFKCLCWQASECSKANKQSFLKLQLLLGKYCE
jgi:hypothetical protein